MQARAIVHTHNIANKYSKIAQTLSGADAKLAIENYAMTARDVANALGTITLSDATPKQD